MRPNRILHSKLLLFSLLSCIFAIGIQLLSSWGYNTNIFPKPTYPHYCWKNYLENETTTCRPLCKQATFGLPDMEECHPWLTCDEISEEIEIIRPFSEGAVKKIYLGQWRNQTVIVSKLANLDYKEDFDHHLEMLKSLAPSFYVTQLLGWCNNTIVTQYHKLGDGNQFHELLEAKSFESYQLMPIKFGMCINYIKAIAFLHQSPAGVRVMCDSNTLEKTLSQFLITDELKLVINDLDALPEVKPFGGIKCGHRKLEGDFVAPEQLWPFNKAFNDTEMPLYDHKTDIWKIPDVCNWFLQDKDSELVRYRIHNINSKCKDKDFKKRPSAVELLQFYETVWEDLYLYK